MVSILRKETTRHRVILLHPIIFFVAYECVHVFKGYGSAIN